MNNPLKLECDFNQLQKQFGIASNQFAIVLVNKDGTGKTTTPTKCAQTLTNETRSTARFLSLSEAIDEDMYCFIKSA